MVFQVIIFLKEKINFELKRLQAMFKKYNSIENTYQSEFLDKIKTHGFWNETFIVQEKVHGANLSFWTTDGIHFNTAKRTGEIDANDDFYNYKTVLNNIKSKLTLLWGLVKVDFPELEQLTIFGELFGGNYPSQLVSKNKLATPIQKGIYYSPDNHFYAFDILINKVKYLSVDTINAYFEKLKLLHAKTIFKGTLDDCLKYSNDFDSTISDELGLPKTENNTIEGVVIKPIKSLFFNDGSKVILKNKNDKWAEKIKRTKKIEANLPPSKLVLELQNEIKNYITVNRLLNVISKIGEVTIKDTGKVMGMFNKDIVDDFTKDNHKILTELDKKEIKSINKSISESTKKMVLNELRK